MKKSCEKNKKLTAKIDWLRLTLIPNLVVGYTGSWLEDSQIYIVDFLQFFGFDLKVEELLIEKGTSLGYTHVYRVIDGFEIQLNNSRRDMGLCFNISGKGCDKLLLHFQTFENDGHLFYNYIFQKFEDFKNVINTDENYLDNFETNVTRCDLALDYYNYSWTVDKLYKKIANKTTNVFYEKFNSKTQTYHETKSTSEVYAMMNDNIFQTMYVGRAYSGMTYQVRVYNKMLERSMKGQALDDSKIYSHNRIEIELHDYLAKSFFINALECTHKNDFIRLMVIYICRRFRLRNKKDYHQITKEMLKIIDGKQVLDFRPVDKDKTLQAKYDYLVDNSGLVSFAQVLMDSVGEDRLEEFFENVKHLAKTRDKNETTEKLINDISNQPTHYRDIILKDE